MKTDSIFYDIFKDFPEFFFELIGKPETNIKAYEFQVPEIKQSSFRLDGVFTTGEEYSDEPLYFVEVQFYKDDEFYERLFASIFLYFMKYQPVNTDWYAIVIYNERKQERSISNRYKSLIEPHLRRFYLEDLRTKESLGLGIIKLIVENEQKAGEYAKELIEQVRQELTEDQLQEKVIDFIETIIIYKFPTLSRKEIGRMLNLDLMRQTRVYQEGEEKGKEEGKEEGKKEERKEIITKLLLKGMSVQEVASLLDLDAEEVREAASS